MSRLYLEWCIQYELFLPCENETGFRPLLCTHRLNWANRTSWGWWDERDETALQPQDSSPGGLRPSTLPLGHGGSPHYWVLRVEGEDFVFLPCEQVPLHGTAAVLMFGQHCRRWANAQYPWWMVKSGTSPLLYMAGPSCCCIWRYRLTTVPWRYLFVLLSGWAASRLYPERSFPCCDLAGPPHDCTLNGPFRVAIWRDLLRVLYGRYILFAVPLTVFSRGARRCGDLLAVWLSLRDVTCFLLCVNAKNAVNELVMFTPLEKMYFL